MSLYLGEKLIAGNGGVIDYVVERGSKVVDYTSWKWEKWASGKVEMWGYYNNPSVIFNTSESGKYASNQLSLYYPFTLVTDEIGQSSYVSITGDTQNRMSLGYVIPSLSGVSFLLYNSVQQTTGVYAHLWIRVTGNWK